MSIHQFVHTLQYGDAISGEALVIQRVLRESGIESDIFSLHAHEKVADFRRPASEFEATLEAAREKNAPLAVINHYSIASPLNALFLEAVEFPRAVVYHNLTPVRWFSAYNSRVAEDLRVGRNELPAIIEAADIVVADSTYNLSEVASFVREGAQALVLPLPCDGARWEKGANPGIVRAMKSHGGVNLLHVGRMAPNKKIEDIIKSFYFYHHKINKKSRLWLIGGDIDTEIYSFELRRLVTELRLREAVAFVGSVSDDELQAFYEQADLYLCMSEHEGFCVPLLEAMRFRVPIVAFASTAIPETVGDGAVLVAEKNPAGIAELIDAILQDATLREALVSRGAARVKEFSVERFKTKLLKELVTPLRNLPVSRATNISETAAALSAG